MVEEAATDVIAAAHAMEMDEPWRDPAFIDAIVRLQRERQIRASYQPDEIQFHDRSAVCTAALAAYLGYPASTILSRELARIRREAIYQSRVFFVRGLGFIKPTEARRISLEEAVRFEKIHEEIYREFGFELFPVGPGSVEERVRLVKEASR